NKQTAIYSTDIPSDNYFKFLVEELKPYIDSAYATKSEMKNTFVAGSGMGGLISIYAICEYPKVFGGAACLSTHWEGIFASKNNPIPAAFVQYLSKHLPDPSIHYIYFDFGTAPSDSLYGTFQMQVDSVLQVKGFDQNRWKSMKHEGANYSKRSWMKRLPIPVVYLLDKR
ncbi:MAG: alpha/beta hydrolase-fold protein, partial [Bacteroidales bacterium]|nr:alpha/beta hydrolase-fold protein [Bacteroidales bacterium]